MENRDVPRLTLTSGSHTAGSGQCAMEAVAMLAREPHSDSPQCACPVLGAWTRLVNDARWSSAEARTEAMWPLVLALVGSRDPAREKSRAEGLALLALTRWAPRALFYAVVALENAGIDCRDLRAASLALVCNPSEITARAAAWAVDEYTRYGTAEVVAAAFGAAHAASGCDAANYSEDAAYAYVMAANAAACAAAFYHADAVRDVLEMIASEGPA